MNEFTYEVCVTITKVAETESEARYMMVDSLVEVAQSIDEVRFIGRGLYTYN